MVVPCVVIGRVVAVVPVIVPLQASVVVGGVKEVTSHCSVISVRIGITGSVVSQ